MKTDTETTTAHTQCADVAQQVEQRSRKATVVGSIPIVGSLIAILFACMLACASFDYGKALFQCDIANAGNHTATYACLCQVAKQNGRSCDFLTPDAGAGVDAPQPKDAGAE